MARPLRIEFEGAVYHITARGNGRQDIFLGDEDRAGFLAVLADVVDRFGWMCHAYCLMSNHYHLLIETPQANLSKGMRHLNGVYTQAFNRGHGRVGHVLQGRFGSILVEKESHLLELARYVVVNPVRANMVRYARQWKWSSYRATAGQTAAPEFLTTKWILSQFHGNVDRAHSDYRQFVKEGRDVPAWDGLRGGVLLGSEGFVERMRPLLKAGMTDREIPRRQRLATRPALKQLFANTVDDKAARNAKIHEAVRLHQYTLAEIEAYVGLHYSTISRIAKRVEGSRKNARNKI
ncbi:MAG: transposase [Candidatus Bipolaricaulia bacterium]